MTTTIITKNSSTASAVPLAADLTSGELAINLSDKRLFAKNGSTVFEVGTTPSTQAVTGNATVGGTLGVTGATTLAATSATTLSASSTVTLSAGTANGVAYLNGSKVLTTGSALTWNGSTFFANGTIQQGNGGAATIGKIWNDSGLYSVQADYTNVNGLKLDSPAYTVFTLNNAEQMRLTSTGLGIGTSSPVAKLSVISASANSTAATIGGIEYGGNKRGLTIKTYQSNGGDDCGVEFNAANGLANYGSFKFSANTTTLATLDSAGNLGLGVTPSAWGQSGTLQAVQIKSTSIAGSGTNAYWGSNWYGGGFDKYISGGTVSASLLVQTGGQFIFQTAGAPASHFSDDPITFTQAMTLDASGNLLVGTTSSTYAANGIRILAVQDGGLINVGHASGTSSGTVFFGAAYAGSAIGSITQAGTTGVLYNITSDYRLKDIAGPVTDSGTFIDKLNPVQGSWKADGSRFIGFLAHELQEASETVVGAGVKDGEEMQSIDYSNAELIANLVAELQSLRARVAQLESK